MAMLSARALRTVGLSRAGVRRALLSPRDPVRWGATGEEEELGGKRRRQRRISQRTEEAPNGPAPVAPPRQSWTQVGPGRAASTPPASMRRAAAAGPVQLGTSVQQAQPPAGAWAGEAPWDLASLEDPAVWEKYLTRRGAGRLPQGSGAARSTQGAGGEGRPKEEEREKPGEKGRCTPGDRDDRDDL